VSERRVVVTGLGMVTPLGHDAESTWSALLAGKSGVTKITEFPTDRLRSDVAAMVRDYDAKAHLTSKESEIFGRVVPFALGAAVEALAMAGLDKPKAEGEIASPGPSARLGLDASRVGVLMSTGQGAVDVFEAQLLKAAEKGPRVVSPFFIPAVMLNVVPALVAMRYGFMGPSYNIASACATGTHSVATSAMMIQAGEADVMVAGGAEAATRVATVAGFGNARALGRAIDGDPTKTSRPYDKRRNGFVMGEGAGALVLEEEGHARARGAKILARLVGYGMTSDGHHLTGPHADGLGLRLAIERALARAGVSAADVGYINPHATSTPQGDLAEHAALKVVFGDALRSIAISATKSMLGHLLGGAGGVEAAVTVLSLRDQRVHPSINADELDEGVELDLVREARNVDLRYAIKLSAGFGGHNCALLFERA
jgi:3-oxoacyl-[acyl-carrier-protein] synthase II